MVFLSKTEKMYNADERTAQRVRMQARLPGDKGPGEPLHRTAQAPLTKATDARASKLAGARVKA